MKSSIRVASLLAAIGATNGPRPRYRSAVKHSTPPETVAFLKERAKAKRIRKANCGPGFSRKGLAHV